ncbi:uncharacterized protein LOC144300597 isoform X2 [Canis aureus]
MVGTEWHGAMHTLYLRVQCQNVGEEWCTVPDEVYICSHLNKSCKAGAAPESVQIISPQIWTPGHSSCTQMNAPMSKLPLQPVQSHLDCWQMVFSEQGGVLSSCEKSCHPGSAGVGSLKYHLVKLGDGDRVLWRRCH